MSQKKIWYLAGSIFVLAILAFSVAGYYAGRTSIVAEMEQAVVASSTETAAQSSPTREEVPAGTKVPGPDSEVPPEVAAPTEAKPAGGSSSIYLRDFTVTVSDGVVLPENVVVNAGDMLNVTFESKDRSYEFVQPDYSLKWTVPAGGSKSLRFQATQSGKFIFYCPSCGGPDEGPVGYIIAVQK